MTLPSTPTSRPTSATSSRGCTRTSASCTSPPPSLTRATVSVPTRPRRRSTPSAVRRPPPPPAPVSHADRGFCGGARRGPRLSYVGRSLAVENAEAFLAWALREPRVAAVIPFHWESAAAAAIGPGGVPSGHTGLGDRRVFPRCEAAWNAIGLLVRAGRGNTTLRAPLPALTGLPTRALPVGNEGAPHCACKRANVMRPGCDARTPACTSNCPWAPLGGVRRRRAA